MIKSMTKLTARSSTIFIATGNKTKVYHSLSEVPPELRRKLDDSTKGTHSATILIADRRGREELVRALQGKASDLRPTLSPRPGSTASTSQPVRKSRFNLRTSLEILLPLMLGASVWLFVATRF